MVVVVASEYAGSTVRVPPHALALTSEGVEDADAGAAATIPDPKRISELNSSPVTRVLVRRRVVSSKEEADISSLSVICAVGSAALHLYEHLLLVYKGIFHSLFCGYTE